MTDNSKTLSDSNTVNSSSMSTDALAQRISALDQKLDSVFTAMQLTAVNNVKGTEASLRKLIEDNDVRYRQSIYEMKSKIESDVRALTGLLDGLKVLIEGLAADNRSVNADLISAAALPAVQLDVAANGSNEHKVTAPAPAAEKATPPSSELKATVSKKATVEDATTGDDEVKGSACQVSVPAAKPQQPAEGESDGTAKPTTTVEGGPSATTSKPASNDASSATFLKTKIIERDAASDYIAVNPFTDGNAFEAWCTSIDGLYFGHKNEVYRATLIKLILADDHQPIANWVKTLSPEFIEAAKWPDLRGSMREIFNPALTTPEEYIKWAKKLKEIAPDYFDDPFASIPCPTALDILSYLGISLLPVSCSASTSTCGGSSSTAACGCSIPNCPSTWGASLSSGNLAGAFKTPAAASTAPVSRSDAATSGAGTGKPPPPPYQAVANNGTSKGSTSNGRGGGGGGGGNRANGAARSANGRTGWQNAARNGHKPGESSSTGAKHNTAGDASSSASTTSNIKSTAGEGSSHGINRKSTFAESLRGAWKTDPAGKKRGENSGSSSSGSGSGSGSGSTANGHGSDTGKGNANGSIPDKSK